MGDFNSKIGNDNTGVKEYIGRHGLPDNMIQNGERLIEFCEMSNFAIANSFFPHRDIYEITWNSPDNKKKIKSPFLYYQEIFIGRIGH
jgi:hypothetical protein